jgi:hypothetical protein
MSAEIDDRGEAAEAAQPRPSRPKSADPKDTMLICSACGVPVERKSRSQMYCKDGCIESMLAKYRAKPERPGKAPAEPAEATPRPPPRLNTPLVCPGCRKTVKRTTHRQVYCKEKCRRKNARQRGRNPETATDAITGRLAPIKPNRNGHPNQGFRGSRNGILAPAGVIEAELFSGRGWEPETSTDGVKCMVWRRKGKP